jgi:hypothetical protein
VRFIVDLYWLLGGTPGPAIKPASKIVPNRIEIAHKHQSITKVNACSQCLAENGSLGLPRTTPCGMTTRCHFCHPVLVQGFLHVREA